jgi:hypothetical protein
VVVLILAPDLDPTADCMVALLGERGVKVFRVNTAWFPTQVQVSVELHDARWHGVLTAPHGKLDLDRVQAVWYRSPEAYQMPPELSPSEAHHARVEAKYGLGGVLASLPVLWCNHPSTSYRRTTRYRRTSPHVRRSPCPRNRPPRAGRLAPWNPNRIGMPDQAGKPD